MLLPLPSIWQKAAKATPDRLQMLKWLDKLMWPTLNWPFDAIAFPAQGGPTLDRGRAPMSGLEAICRIAVGISPWLASKPASVQEEALRYKFEKALLDKLSFWLHPNKIDALMALPGHAQVLVEMAFLAQACLASNGYLWRTASEQLQRHMAEAWIKCRKIKPYQNNWLLFAGVVEVALEQLAGQPPVIETISTALTSHAGWFKGDGHYGDGPWLHADYYNSFVIHPLLLTITAQLPVALQASTPITYSKILARAQRYAMVQERLCAANHVMPAIGRSLCYRTGILHLPAMLASQNLLPNDLPLGQWRTFIIGASKQFIDNKQITTREGILTPGMYGYQPKLAELYIQTGSLYLCSVVFQVLALPDSHSFWTSKPEKTTSQQLEAGNDIAADHAMKED